MKKKPVVARKQAIAPCQLIEAPSLRGLKLGQSPDDIDRFIVGFSSEYDKQSRNSTSTITQTDFSGPLENREKWIDVGGVYISGYFDENSNFIIQDFIETPRNPLRFLEDSEGISGFNLWFFKNKLYGFSVSYSDYEPPTGNSFVKQFAPKTNLPLAGWNADDMSAVLRCKGFKVELNVAYRNFASATITDTIAEGEVLRLEKEIKLARKRQEQERIREEQRRKETLKP